MNIKFVNIIDDPMDEHNYGYAVCECTTTCEGIRIDRPNETQYIRFNCPRCQKPLGITLMDKKSFQTRTIYERTVGEM